VKPKNLIMYIVDDFIIIWNNNEIYKEKLSKKAIYLGKIYNEYIFFEDIKNIFNKINKSIFNANLTILLNPSYTQFEIHNLKSVLEKLSVNKINFINITKLFDIKQNSIYLLINNKYIYIIRYNYKHKIESTFIDYKMFNYNKERLANYVKTIIKSKKLILVGYNKELAEIANTIEQITNNKTYYVTDSNSFIINKIKNTLFL